MPQADCFGRDVFGGADPESPEEASELRRPERGALRSFISEHRRVVALFVAAAAVTAFVIWVLPQITGLGTTLRKLGHGNALWLLVGVVLESVSLVGYIVLFRAVFSCEGTRIGWKASYEITMAGVVATKLLAAAGAGGIALTAWALRAAGLSARAIARRMAGFEIVLYAVFMLTVLLVGIGLGTGVLGLYAPWTLSYLPAAFGGVVILLALSVRFVPARLEQRVLARVGERRRIGRFLARLATVPTAMREGLGTAIELLREFHPGLLGAVVYWGFDIATLWVAFKAFGANAPAVPVVIMAYFVGQLGNVLPLPGGIGGVEGGMIGCFIALDVNAGAALVAVFAYRAISFWLPTLPGAVAYLQLRHRIAGWRDGESRGGRLSTAAENV